MGLAVAAVLGVQVAFSSIVAVGASPSVAVVAGAAVAASSPEATADRPYTWWLSPGFEPMPVDRLVPVLQILALSPEQQRAIAVAFGDHVARVHELVDEHAARDPRTFREDDSQLEMARLASVGHRRSRRLAEDVVRAQGAFIDAIAAALSDDQHEVLAAARPALTYDTINFKALGVLPGTAPINVAGLVVALVDGPERRFAALAVCRADALAAERAWRFLGLDRMAAWHEGYLAALEADPDLDYAEAYPAIEEIFRRNHAPILDRAIRAGELDLRALSAAMRVVGTTSPDALRLYGGAIAMASPNLDGQGAILVGLGDRLARHEAAVAAADDRVGKGDAPKESGPDQLAPEVADELRRHAAELKAAVDSHVGVLAAYERGRGAVDSDAFMASIRSINEPARAANDALRAAGGRARRTATVGGPRMLFASRAGGRSWTPGVTAWSCADRIEGVWHVLVRSGRLDSMQPAVRAFRERLAAWAPIEAEPPGIDRAGDGAAEAAMDDAPPRRQGPVDPYRGQVEAPDGDADGADPASSPLSRLATTRDEIPLGAWSQTHAWLDANATMLGPEPTAWCRYLADVALREQFASGLQLADWPRVPLGLVLLRHVDDPPGHVVDWLRGFESQRVTMLRGLSDDDDAQDGLDQIGGFAREAVMTLATMLGEDGRGFLDALDRRRVPWILDRHQQLAGAIRASSGDTRPAGHAAAPGAPVAGGRLEDDADFERRLDLALLDRAMLELRHATRDADTWLVEGVGSQPAPSGLRGERAVSYEAVVRQVEAITAAARVLQALQDGTGSGG